MTTSDQTWLTEQVEQLAADGTSSGELLATLPVEVLRDAVIALRDGFRPAIPSQDQFAALRIMLQVELDSRARART